LALLLVAFSLAAPPRSIAQNRLQRLDSILGVFQNCINLSTFEYARRQRRGVLTGRRR